MQDELSPAITVLIRFHTVTRLRSLDEGLFSLLTQNDVSVSVTILCQQLSEEDHAAVEDVAAIYNRQGLSVTAINERFSERGDHRAELLNRGLSRTHTRYVAFLDSDDVLYPNCYTRLITRLQNSEAAIAFGGVLRSDQFKLHDAVHVQRKFRPIPDLPKLLFFRCNQYPIHSYVLDLQRIDRADAYFDVGHSRNEDYAFLVRILSKYDTDTYECKRTHCEYRVDIDGENTIPIFHSDEASDFAWAESERYVESIKSKLKISTSAGDIKHLITWCEDNAKATSRVEINNLSHQIHVLQEKLASEDQKTRKAKTALADYLQTATAGQFSDALTLNIEAADKLDDTTSRVRGWCAGRGHSPIMMAYRRYDQAIAEKASGSYSEFHHRQDVADHLGSDDAHYGFEIEIPISREIEIFCLCSDGRIYRATASVDVSRG